MFERNSVAGKIFHIFLVHPIQYALLWYYIIEFPGSVNVEDVSFIYFVASVLSVFI
jgi:hypothetical protein